MSEPLRIAAIDLGTNSVRLIVAEVEGPDRYRVLDDERDQTRLGLGLQETGRIAPESAAATLDALERMKRIAEGLGVVELRAVATAALRDAENGYDVVDEIRCQTGLELEVITPEEEAELALRSVRCRFPLEGPAAVVDIGGGSMEVVFATDGAIDGIHSLPLGAVRLTERFIHSDPLDEPDWEALRTGIDRELEDSIGVPPFPTPTIIGSGGTFTTVALMAIHDRTDEPGPVQGYSMTVAEFDHQLHRLRESSLRQRTQMPGLSPERADIILAGATAVSRLAKLLDADRVEINDRGIRDGLLLEMISRLLGSGTSTHDRALI